MRLPFIQRLGFIFFNLSNKLCIIKCKYIIKIGRLVKFEYVI